MRRTIKLGFVVQAAFPRKSRSSLLRLSDFGNNAPHRGQGTRLMKSTEDGGLIEPTDGPQAIPFCGEGTQNNARGPRRRQ